jgi:hypothetical protein
MERQNMSSAAITTMGKMMELLPEDMQNKIVEHLREYIEDLNDEMQWNATFQKTQQQLVAAARKVKQEIAEGKATPL